jgi:hypothetical protein
MTTELILQIFSGIAFVGLVSWLLDDPHDDDNGPDDGLLSPVMGGV